MNKKQKVMLVRIVITSILMVTLHFLPFEGFSLMKIPAGCQKQDFISSHILSLVMTFFGKRFSVFFMATSSMKIFLWPSPLPALWSSVNMRKAPQLCSLSDWRTFPELRCRQEPPQYHRADGYSSRLRQY